MTYPIRGIGIDEVGRGALAGPIVVGAVFLTRKGYNALKKISLPLRDSKKLTEKQRNAWCAHIRVLHKHKLLIYSTASLPPHMIDRVNVARAANQSATSAFKKLLKRDSRLRKTKIFLDGGLYLDKRTLVSLCYTKKPNTIIKGDEKIPAIQLASIVAKVTRDTRMRRFHADFPNYAFAVHKGYGTQAHISILKRIGASSIHRKTFLTHIL